jgi:hypothetical protein
VSIIKLFSPPIPPHQILFSFKSTYHPDYLKKKGVRLYNFVRPYTPSR